MVRAFSALMVVAGCFAPTAPAGAPCATGAGGAERCPAGLVCVRHDGIDTCEASAGEGADRDADRVDDVVDNCPDVANAAQADEDADGVGDACDPCPPFVGVDDADGDGLGDACDPNPTTAGDRMIAFEGFTTAPTSPWVLTSRFVAANGEGMATADEVTSTLATFPSPTGGRVEVRATATLASVTATAMNLGGISIVERYTPADDKGVACQLTALASAEQQQLRIFDLDKRMVIDSAPHPFVVGSELDLRLRRVNSLYSCRATNPVLELGGTSALMAAAPRIGVRVRGAVARVHWILITTSP